MKNTNYYRVRAAAACIALLVLFACLFSACAVTPAKDPSSDPTEAPSSALPEEATPEVSSSPVAETEPPEESTPIPAPDEEWFIEKALSFSSAVSELYSLTAFAPSSYPDLPPFYFCRRH